MAETNGLLNRRTGKSGTEGSNPSVSATPFIRAQIRVGGRGVCDQSISATARIQPALARSILTGKQESIHPEAGSAARLVSFSIW